MADLIGQLEAMASGALSVDHLTCPACEKVSTSFKDSRRNRRGDPGGVMLCRTCGHLYWVNIDGTVRPVSRKLLAGHSQREEIRAAQDDITRHLIG